MSIETGSPRPMPLRPLALALLIIIADQVSKLMLIDLMADRSCREIGGLPHLCEPVVLTSWFNLVMVWNTGVSFGLFSNGGDSSRYILGVINLVVATGLTIWLWRTPETRLRLGLAFVIGGAVGNAIDRFNYGAVADFFDVFLSGAAGEWAFRTLGSNHWPAFNIADMAISLGVIILVFDSLFGGGESSKRAS
ncbi:signal peptidase II [Minwuia sp.]|uniref:signal peptidase II n=1 Tax=Minwuia sp. TaxID=2493630 RepID=UPI003A91539E